MAENVLMTRIQLKYDTLSNWNSSTLVLKEGELAIAEVPSSSSNSGLTPPAIGIKVGNGRDRFLNLPWIQSTAGDVHPWAKAANKPVYTANEISGLNEYISGTINDTNTQYQIIAGSGNDVNKYFFQKKEIGESWITAGTIDFTDLAGRILTLESWATTNVPLLTQINNQINVALSGLNYTDNAVSHQFVTAVSQTNGKILTSRAQPAMSDISGRATVAQGGTGLSTIATGEVLIGNGTEAIATKPIDRTVGTSDNLITSGAVKAYVDSITFNVTSPMRFIGRATQPVYDGGQDDPQIANYEPSTWQRGDVILSSNNYSEFVWTGESWEMLGNEGSFIFHGAVTDEEIPWDAAISPLKIASVSQNYNIAEDIENKVDKVNGKGLSTEDYTSAEKNKLAGIAAGAQANTIESISINGVTISPDQNKNIDLSVSLGTETIQGAQVPSIDPNFEYEDITLNSTTNKLQFARIAKTGNVNDLQQTTGDVLILQCGSSSDII